MPIQTWKPDTCDCVIEERHAEGAGVVFERVVSKCSLHTVIVDGSLHGLVLVENRRKNMIHKRLVETPSLGLGETNAEGSFVFKLGIGFTWVWSGTGESRVITITVTGTALTAPQRSALHGELDAEFGVGKVILA